MGLWGKVKKKAKRIGKKVRKDIKRKAPIAAKVIRYAAPVVGFAIGGPLGAAALGAAGTAAATAIVPKKDRKKTLRRGLTGTAIVTGGALALAAGAGTGLATSGLSAAGQVLGIGGRQTVATGDTGEVYYEDEGGGVIGGGADAISLGSRMSGSDLIRENEEAYAAAIKPAPAQTSGFFGDVASVLGGIRKIGEGAGVLQPSPRLQDLPPSDFPRTDEGGFGGGGGVGVGFDPAPYPGGLPQDRTTIALPRGQEGPAGGIPPMALLAGAGILLMMMATRKAA